MTFTKPRVTSLVASLLLSFSLGSAHAAEWLMASGYPDSNFMTKNIRQMIADVNEATGGDLEVTLHANDSLIKLDNIRRAVQKGQVQMGEIRLGVYSNEDPMYSLAALPFIAPDYESAWALMEAQKPYFDAAMGKLGVKVLAYQPWPGQGFYTRFPVKSVDDFKAKKLRIYSKPTQQMGSMLGFEATILPFADIPQAFATGLIEALFTSPQTGIDIQAWDNTDYFTLAGAIYSKNAIVVNQKAFDGLSPKTQAALVAAGDAATKRGWELSASTLEEQMGVLAEKGMIVEQAPPAVIEQMKTIGQAMMVDWRKEASADGNAVLDAYLEGR